MINPQNNWIKIETEEEVIIPTSDGKGIAEKIKVKVPAYRDPKTDEIYLDGEALRMLDDVKARHLGLLTTDEIKSLRQRLDCTQSQISELLQIGEKTWTRWESGRERPSKSLNLLLRALFEGRINVPWLKAQRDPICHTRDLAKHVKLVHYIEDLPPEKIMAGILDEARMLPGFPRSEERRSVWMKIAIALDLGDSTQPFGQVVMHYGSASKTTDGRQSCVTAWSRRNQSVNIPSMEVYA
jgi:DNA-binding transcriptional regulator YiaG